MKRTPMPYSTKRLERRTGMPPRTSGLAPSPLGRGTTGLERHTPLARKTELKRSAKPLPAVNKERQARKTEAAGMSKGDVQDVIHARSGGWCELRIPGVCLGRATNIMHRLPEGQGGLYLPSTLVDGCGFGNNHGGCHEYQERHRIEAREKGWLVHSNHDPREQPIHMWVRVNDEEWVEGDWFLDDAGGAVPFEASGEAA